VLSTPDSKTFPLVPSSVPDFPRPLHQFWGSRSPSSRGGVTFPGTLGHRCESVIRCKSVSRLGKGRRRPYPSACTATEREASVLQSLKASFQCLGGLKISRWAVNVVPPLPFYAYGNVVILGDAVGIRILFVTYRSSDHEHKHKAHAMTPFQGAGAGQAIEVSQLVPWAMSNRIKNHCFPIFARMLQCFPHCSRTI